MKENTKIENNAGPPEQNAGGQIPCSARLGVPPLSGTSSSTESALSAVPLANAERLTTDRVASGPCHSSAGPLRKRAPYRHHNHRRTGKVARLPAAVRQEICLMFTRYIETETSSRGLAPTTAIRMAMCTSMATAIATGRIQFVSIRVYPWLMSTPKTYHSGRKPPGVRNRPLQINKLQSSKRKQPSVSKGNP